MDLFFYIIPKCLTSIEFWIWFVLFLAGSFVFLFALTSLWNKSWWRNAALTLMASVGVAAVCAVCQFGRILIDYRGENQYLHPRLVSFSNPLPWNEVQADLKRFRKKSADRQELYRGYVRYILNNRGLRPFYTGALSPVYFTDTELNAHYPQVQAELDSLLDPTATGENSMEEARLQRQVDSLMFKIGELVCQESRDYYMSFLQASRPQMWKIQLAALVAALAWLSALAFWDIKLVRVMIRGGRP